MTKLPQHRYVEALKRQKARIVADAVPLTGVDDDSPGSKSTECSWGLCSDDKEAWPDAQDHLWPDEFERYGRVAPLYRKPQQLCPMDTREKGNKDSNGCYWTCRFFNGEQLTKEVVVALYDKRLQEAA